MVMTDPDGHPVAFGWRDGEQRWLEVPEVATYGFAPWCDEVRAHSEPAASDEEVMDAFRSIAVPLMLQISGLEVLHASGAVVGPGVVAICAASGTGKTTLACALDRAGHELWSDDAVVLDLRAGQGAVTYRLPFRANVRPETRREFAIREGGEPAPAADLRGRALRAICVLERVPASEPDAHIERLHPAAALPVLIEHAQRFDLSEADDRDRTVTNYLALASDVPVLRMRLGSGFEKLGAAVAALEHALEQASLETR